MKLCEYSHRRMGGVLGALHVRRRMTRAVLRRVSVGVSVVLLRVADADERARTINQKSPSARKK